ncbi:hypothetical protein MRX96_016819 [Rhipicephalus microplus]
MALPAATAVAEAPPAAAATLAAQPAAIVPGGRPAVPMAPAAPPAATVALPPADPAYQIVAILLNTLCQLSGELVDESLTWTLMCSMWSSRDGCVSRKSMIAVDCSNV